tara:strand:- start:27714 stop:27905 length:192 start_codon:yes stop_codon:yes gene_type:complete
MNIKRSSKRGKRVRIGILELPIAPIVDVVFLLLFYLMVSSNLQKQEADISFSLSGRIQQDEAV